MTLMIIYEYHMLVIQLVSPALNFRKRKLLDFTDSPKLMHIPLHSPWPEWPKFCPIITRPLFFCSSHILVFWYLGHFSYVIFFPGFFPSYLALQNGHKLKIT